MAPMDNYQLLIEKLDQFIRKYYVNQLIRGGLYSTGLILAMFLGMAFLENYFYFSPPMRKLLFYSFIGVSGLAITTWVVLPMLHYFRLGKLISHERAAQIIGNHFSDVKDKLLNILQLKRQASNMQDAELIMASINQKSDEIRPVPFKAAINLNQNRKYLRYALPPLLLLLVILFAAPSLIRDSTNRLINNNKEFKKPAPFQFVVDPEALKVVQFEDFVLTTTVEGSVLPNDVFVTINEYQYRMTKESPNTFSYRINNVQDNVDFNLFSSGVQSEDYQLNVLKKPNVAGFEVKLDYPVYTGRKDESLQSVGDLVVPEGTVLNWVLTAGNTDQMQVRFHNSGELLEANRFSDELFTFKKQAKKDDPYTLYVSNKDLPVADSVRYTITVIPDAYPSIDLRKFEDSTDQKLVYFVGDAADDYGLLSLSFNYRIKNPDGREGDLQLIRLKKPEGTQARFEYTFDINDLELKPGQQVSYYFEAFDNDGVNGSKSTKTSVMYFAMPTVRELEERAEKNDDQIKSDLLKSMEESKKIQDELKKLREKLLQEKEMNWQAKKELEKLLERQKELEKQIQEAKEAFEENMKNQQQLDQQDEELMEKQEKLQKMFEEVMSDEMRQLMEQIEKLMQELEKDQALEMMEDFQFSNEDMEKQLDRMQELFKQLELESEVKKAVDKLEEMAQEEEKLSQETQDQQGSQEELEQKQEELNKEFQDLEKQMDKIEEKNKELERPKELENPKDEMKDIQKDMENSKDQIQQKQNNKASKSQKQAAQKMRELAQKMQSQMQSGEMEQLELDIKALRQLLENLVTLSFDQEKVMGEIATANAATPKYVELVQDQYKLKDDFRLVEDSLQALSKRVFQIESFITEKVGEVKGHMREGLEQLEERKVQQAGDHQQRTMKGVNDLALMLSEVMDQMQQQMSSMMSGNQMCDNPGQGQGKEGQVPMDKISQGQQDLNKEMEDMKERLEKYKEKGSSKQFAQMAAKQAALRKALREKQKQLKERGQGSKEMQDIMDMMDKIETELVNKQLSNETLKRQTEILTRLLEAEKAEKQREFDNKRKAEVAKQVERKLPPSLEEYLKKRESEVELYKTPSPALNPYYKNLVQEYLKTLKKQ